MAQGYTQRWRRWVGLFCILGLVATACSANEPGDDPVPLFTPAQPTAMPTPTLAAQVNAGAANGSGTAAPAPVDAATATVPPTAAATATPILPPEESLAQGDRALYEGNSALAVEAYRAALANPAGLSDEFRQTVQLQLARAYLAEARYQDAAGVLNQFLAARASQGDPGSQGSEAYYLLGQAYAGLGSHDAAVGAYQSYLAANPHMTAYVQPRLAEQYLAQEDTAAAIAAYEAALTGSSERLYEIGLRQTLADLYLAGENYAAAVEQFDAIYALARTDNTRGQMTYQAGRAALLGGDSETGYARYLRGVNEYPRVYESYLGLVELVNAGVAVDAFQRGVVDYYAGAYQPALEVFQAYIAANQGSYRPEAHLYRAWSHENLGNLDAALAELEAYAAYGQVTATPPPPTGTRSLDENPPQLIGTPSSSGTPAATVTPTQVATPIPSPSPVPVAGPYEAAALIERADMLRRAGRAGEALADYERYLATFPAGEGAAHALLALAGLQEDAGDMAAAVAALLALADGYPAYEPLPEALFRAGMRAYEAGDLPTAQLLWQRAADQYPAGTYGAASFVWLLRTVPAESVGPIATAVLSNTRQTGYYALRARELVAGQRAYQPPAGYQFEFDDAAAQAETEDWLRSWLPASAAATVTSTLSSAIMQDGRFARGQALWQLGQWAEARGEFESLRADYAGDAVASYQLALFFRDMGLYRSSIGAAASILALSGQTVFDVPSLIGRLNYPAYYADLVLPLAEQYGYDPLLQFALVRQESLFESFVASYVGAQGLSQVMPATGDYIAGRLNWPNYETADLYRPFVGLAFGAFYIGQQMGLFNNNAYVALSAYNAGPGNAARWYEIAGDDVDRYLETVDFAETRLYIERIYEGYWYYRHLYGQDE